MDRTEDRALEEVFRIDVTVGAPILVGRSATAGRRQLIPILSGELTGPGLHGTVLPGGVDSQVIRPDGRCLLSARYGVALDDGGTFYIENNGLRTVPEPYREDVLEGRFVDPGVYYFRTVPTLEVYREQERWLLESLFVCEATRWPDKVRITFHRVL